MDIIYIHKPDLDLFLFFKAHARLMARDCVLQQDAVIAVMIIESAVGSSKMCSMDSFFPEDPDYAYKSQEQQVMNMLGIGHHSLECSMEAC